MEEICQAMENELRLRGLADRTVVTYVECVKRFAAFHGREPGQMGGRQIRAYLLHLTEQGRAWSTVNQAICALRHLYVDVLEKPFEVQKVRYQRKKRQRLPEVLSPEEVSRLLRATHNLKYRAILMTLYSAGLRLGEGLGLEVSDVDSSSMIIRVRSAKGGRERRVMLSRKLLGALRGYYRAYRPRKPLFYGRDKTQPLAVSSVQRAIKSSARAAGLDKRVTAHTLRHSFATHLMESGTNLRYIQELLGHKSIKTTMIYTRVGRQGALQVVSPLDRLDLDL